MQDNSYSSPIDFRISQVPSPQLPEEVKGSFEEVYAAIQQIIQTLVNNCGIGQQPIQFWDQIASQAITSTLNSQNTRRLYVTASEALAFGAMISLHLSGGLLKARNANATDTTKPIDGFCSTVGGIASGTVGETTLNTGLATITGLTVGSRYFLSTTNGLVTATPPSGAGNLQQYAGIAITTTALYMSLVTMLGGSAGGGLVNSVAATAPLASSGGVNPTLSLTPGDAYQSLQTNAGATASEWTSWPLKKQTVALGKTLTVPLDYSLVIFKKLTVRGNMVVRGDARVLS